MFGFAFGTACLIALGIVAARGRHRHLRHHFYRGPLARHALYGVLARLDTTPGQEKIITQAVGEFKDTISRSMRTFERSREPLARAVKGEVFDEGALREAFLEQDGAIAELREALVTAGRKVHETLDERQRKVLGELIESGSLSCGFTPHHYRYFRHHPAYC